MHVETVPVFPSLIHQFKIPCFNVIVDSLVKDILEYKDNNPGVNKSNIGGYQSSDTFWKTEQFKEYFEYIDMNIKNVLMGIVNEEVDIQNAWFNINSKEDYNFPHIHPGSIFSSVLWVKVPENSGSLAFCNPTFKSTNSILFETLNDEFKEKYVMGNEISVTPEVGNIIIFPGYLEHYVSSTQNENDRISIAINYA